MSKKVDYYYYWLNGHTLVRFKQKGKKSRETHGEVYNFLKGTWSDLDKEYELGHPDLKEIIFNV